MFFFFFSSRAFFSFFLFFFGQRGATASRVVEDTPFLSPSFSGFIFIFILFLSTLPETYISQPATVFFFVYILVCQAGIFSQPHENERDGEFPRRKREHGIFPPLFQARFITP